MADTGDSRRGDELDVEGEPLPPREVMSLLTTGGSLTPAALPVEGVGDAGAAPAPDTSGGPAAGGQAGSLVDRFVDADASASESESVESEDRSETFSSSDSASAGG